MYDRRCRWLPGLMLVAALAIPSLNAFAQGPSHRLLRKADDTADTAPTEEAMAQRLQQLRLQDLARHMLRDPALLKKLQEEFPPDKLEKLRQEVNRGNGLGSDPKLRDQLLDQLKKSGARKEDIDELKRLSEGQQQRPQGDETQPSQDQPPNPNDGSDGPPRSQPTQQPGLQSTPPRDSTSPPQPPPWWKRLRDKTDELTGGRTSQLPDRMANLLDKLGDGTAGDALREGMRNFGRSSDTALPWHLEDRAGELLAKLSELGVPVSGNSGSHWPDWQSMLSGLRNNLHELDTSSGGAAGPSNFDLQILPLLGWLGAAGLVGYFLWRLSNRGQSKSGPRWQPGPWPIAPGAVSTRGDLVRAFEYLALLCVGPAALTCNHRELAQRLASDANGEHRRAADELADLYERARYTPDNESLVAEDLAAARHDLCLLAGVAGS